MHNLLWNEPTSRDVGLFSDLTLFAEALNLAAERSAVTVAVLEGELEQRVRGHTLIRPPSSRVAYQLMRELRDFRWLIPCETPRGHLNSASYVLTSDGEDARATWRTDRRRFRRLLAEKMHAQYVVPGWLIDRLWRINPKGQGEVIIPAPMRDWKPRSKRWDQNAWTKQLADQASRSAENARTVSKGSFPVSDSDWIDAVRHAWQYLSTLHPKNRQAEDYRPRHRLMLAMHEGATRLLFNCQPYGETIPDFPGHKPPMPPRYFKAWCPRLMALELLVYSDTYRCVNGRLIFPTAVFRTAAPQSRFESIELIRHPDDRVLALHHPEWRLTRDDFWKAVVEAHRKTSLAVKSLYVSLLDVRDSVCRQLRLSADLFDEFLTKGLRELPREGFAYSVSVETDIREDQLTGPGRQRRPIFIGGVPHTLIAVAELSALTRTSP